MTIPSIREALCEARPYVAELATFSPSGARHRELLQRIDAALSAPPQDVVASINGAVTAELERMYQDGVSMCMREGETTWRTYHAGFDLSMFAQRITDAILAPGLVTAIHPDEVISQRTILSSDCVDLDVEAAIRADERERCAKVAEGWLESSWVDEVFAARSIAAAIRAGGAK